MAGLAAAGVAATAASRRAYRELLVTAPGLAGGISGVIPAAETLRQRLRDGRLVPAARLRRARRAVRHLTGGAADRPRDALPAAHPGQRTGALARRVALNVAAVQGRYTRELELGYQVSAGSLSG